MAYDKVVDSAKLDAGLTYICDRIRKETGIPDEAGVTFSFPEGMVQGVSTACEEAYHNGYGKAKDEDALANRQILADCNEALTEKGVETADSLEQVPQRIGEIASFADGYEVGIEQGKQAEHNSFWNSYLVGGITHVYAFAGHRWMDTTYNPNQSIICTISARNMYNGAQITDTKVSIELRCADAYAMFSGCNKLITIRKLGFFGVTNSSLMFTSCSALENITCDGEINSAVGFAACSKLTDESVQSIIDHLADLTGQTALKVTFHSDVLLRLTTEQTDAILAKNWTM